MNLRTPCVVVALGLCLASRGVLARTWTDDTGQFRVEAELVSMQSDVVQLRKPDGSVLRVPLARLSAADREYVEEWKQARLRPERPAGEPKPAEIDPKPDLKPLPGEAADGRPLQYGLTAVERALDEPTKFSFNETPLKDAVKYLSDRHRIFIVMDAAALADVGISSEITVSGDVSGQRLGPALARLLEPMSLAFHPALDGLVITTREAADSCLTVRVYKIIAPIEIDRLVENHVVRVAPTSWDESGGPGSLAVLAPGILVISQTWDVHRQIADQCGKLLRPVPPAEIRIAKPPIGKRATPIQALDQATMCDFCETPLSETVAALAEQHRVGIVLDVKAVQEVGISPDTPVSGSLDGVRLESAIALLFGSQGLTWTIQGDALEITTEEQAGNRLIVQDHNVRDIVAAFRGDLDSIAAMVQTTVCPTSWDQVGGPGSMQFIGNGLALRVSQTIRAHRLIDRVLGDVRQAMGR